MSVSPRKPPVEAGHTCSANGQRSASLASTPLLPEQFKEAFHLLDKDGDGLVNKKDLNAMWTSLGLNKGSSEVDNMLAQLPNPLNFAAYFTAMTSLVSDISSRDDLMSALTTFDEGDNGKIDVAELREALTTGQNALTHAQVDKVLQGYARNGKFNYNAFVENIAGAA